jgi:hypothetical protein
MSQADDLASQVRSRANQQCEYCLMHQALQGATFHVEHVTPRAKGGSTTLENLALACPSCNLHKSDNTTAKESQKAVSVALFNPRTQHWPKHFRFNVYHIEGLTDVGRATVVALHLNDHRRIQIRRAEEKFGLFPAAI